MTKRDLAWRMGGLGLLTGAFAAGPGARPPAEGAGSSVGLLAFIVALLGVVLLVQGKRVAIAWRAERQGHRFTALAVHEQRRRHSRS